MSTTTATPTTDATEDAPSSPPAEQLLRSGQVIKLLNVEWDLECGRETLAKLSDLLGVATRSYPGGHRRWTQPEVEQIAAVLQVRQSDILARGAVETLLKERDQPAVQLLFEALAAVIELPGLRSLSTNAA